MRSPNTHSFSRVPHADIPRSKFRTQFGYKTTFDSGYLIPFFVDEVLPGDTFDFALTSFCRLATPVVPVMDNIYIDYHFWYVPNRLIWKNWVRMMGEQDNPGDSIDYLVPEIVAPDSGVAVQSISDYMGIPVGVGGLHFDALWHRAYNKIWNSWYRDENLQDRVPEHDDDGPDTYTDYTLLPRGKRKDYFAGALPFPQKGEGVAIPLGDTAPVYGDGALRLANQSVYTTSGTYLSSNAPSSNLATLRVATSSGAAGGDKYGVVSKGQAELAPQGSGLYADLSSATAATINSLRQAFQLQRLLERDARGGTRYTELLVSHFGVTSPDSRLQRPEYLGGGSQPVQIHSVTQTSASGSGSTPQGNLAAVGVSGGRVGFKKSFVEHGVLLGLLSVRVDQNYQYGLQRMFSRRGRYDFYWPVLSHLGEQAILNKEIFAQGPSVVDSDEQVIDDQVFGYQERWAEYRYGVSKITGKLRSGVSGSLDVWHLADKYTALPRLNSAFIQSKPPIKRVLAVQDEPEFIFDSVITCDKIRPMPIYSVPGLIDHF